MLDHELLMQLHFIKEYAITITDATFVSKTFNLIKLNLLKLIPTNRTNTTYGTYGKNFYLSAYIG